MDPHVLAHLEQARKELLDLGLRNSLLNYRARSNRINVVDEISDQVYKLLVIDEKQMCFSPLPGQVTDAMDEGLLSSLSEADQDWSIFFAEDDDQNAASSDGTALLTFPSYFRRERKEQPSHPSVLVTYRFDGLADDIYATLVVRLHHTVAFESTDLWKSATDFKTQTGTKLGFTLAREAEGSSRLEVYFEPDVDRNSRVLFLRYVHDHLTEHAQNVVRLRHYALTFG